MRPKESKGTERKGTGRKGTGRKGKERGATMAEYSVMVARLSVVVIAAIRTVGTSVSSQFSRAAGQLG